MKKLTKAAVASVLAANLAFGLAACADTGNGTTPGDNNSGGNNPGGGETQAAALLDEALLTLTEQDYVTFDFDMTGRQIGGRRASLQAASTENPLLPLSPTMVIPAAAAPRDADRDEIWAE